MPLDQDIRRLAGVPMLGLIEPDGLRLLAFASETRILKVGDVLFREGEPSEGGVLIVTGSFSLRASTTKTELVFGPGVLLGEAALIREADRPATATARETSTVFKVSRALFLRVLEEHPGSARKVAAFMAAQMRQQLGLPAGYDPSLTVAKTGA